MTHQKISSEIAVHEAADLFPLMDDKRLTELKDSIRAHGLLHEIILYEGKILDGRNRYIACISVGCEPRFRNYEGDPFAYVWDANGERRDLGGAQRYLIWKEASEKSKAWQLQRQAIQDAANRKRSDAQKGIPKAEKERSGTTSATTFQVHVTREAKAAASKTDRGTVERMDRLCEQRPDLAKDVQKGKKKATAALREMKKAEVAVKVAALPDGKYRVIYADPPWKYNDERSGLGSSDGASAGINRASTAAPDHYPTMTKAELMVLDVKSLAADDCVLFCWATFPLLPMQLEIVKTWGFTYKTSFVWDKGRGSFGNYHKAEAECLFVCTRGSCVPDADKLEAQVQRWPRAGHSRKPEAARDMIDRLYLHGPRIELFCRGEAPKGWAAWGAEFTQEKAA